MTKTAEKPQSREVAAFKSVEQWLVQNVDEVVARLPKHINKDRFNAAALEAIRQNPKLLMCTPRSLFNAFRKAATDGLLPDGREGVITPYKDEAQWNPMTWGLRKRAREIDGIIVDAQVYRQNDTEGHGMIWDQGDEPRIVHRPLVGQDRGGMLGVYAIFKKDGEILHREVMDATQVAAVRAQSKAPDSLMWTKFAEEGWRKAVVRRGFKSIPCSENLEKIIHRDDEQFDIPDDEPARTRPQMVRPAGVTEMLDQISGAADAQIIEHETQKEVEIPKEADPGGLRYDGQTSAKNLTVLLGSLGEQDTSADLRAFAAGMASVVARMQPRHQIEAQVALSHRAGEIAPGEAFSFFANEE